MLHSMSAYGPEKALAVVAWANQAWQLLQHADTPRAQADDSPKTVPAFGMPRASASLSSARMVGSSSSGGSAEGSTALKAQRGVRSMSMKRNVSSGALARLDSHISLCDVEEAPPTHADRSVISNDCPVALGPMPATPAGLKALWESYGPHRLHEYRQDPGQGTWQPQHQQQQLQPTPPQGQSYRHLSAVHESRQRRPGHPVGLISGSEDDTVGPALLQMGRCQSDSRADGRQRSLRTAAGPSTTHSGMGFTTMAMQQPHVRAGNADWGFVSMSGRAHTSGRQTAVTQQSVSSATGSEHAGMPMWMRRSNTLALGTAPDLSWGQDRGVVSATSVSGRMVTVEGGNLSPIQLWRQQQMLQQQQQLQKQLVPPQLRSAAAGGPQPRSQMPLAQERQQALPPATCPESHVDSQAPLPCSPCLWPFPRPAWAAPSALWQLGLKPVPPL